MTEDNPAENAYTLSLIKGFQLAIDGYTGAQVVGTYPIGAPPTREQLRAWDPDCVLYAGRSGAAETLLRSITGQELLVILSDAVIETRGTDDRVLAFGNVRFTYPTDAADFNSHVNVFGMDSVLIARQLLDDLGRKGGDFRYKARMFIHLESIESARGNLAKIMKENAQSRTWYACASARACVFDQHKRVDGLFHVWRRSDDKQKMLDIDGWHPPRIGPSKQ